MFQGFMGSTRTCAVGGVVNIGGQHLHGGEAFVPQACLQPRPHPGLDQHQLLLGQFERGKRLIHLKDTKHIRWDPSMNI